MKETVYITGHRHPDTDSIVSAVAYAFFKRAMGVKAVPCRLGELNTETKYLLKRFGISEPLLLMDARNTLAEIELDEPVSISPETTIAGTIEKMHATGRNSFAVTDREGKIAGYVSKSDLANMALGDTAEEIELLRQTSVKDIAETISGKVIYTPEKTHYNGKTSIVALNKSAIENYSVDDRIVIIGNDSAAQEALIRKGAGMLIIVWADEISESVLSAAREFECPIITSGHGAMNTSRYLFLAPEVRLIMTEKVIAFRQSEYAEDAGRKMLKTRFRSYPVIDDERRLTGYVSRFHILNSNEKKLILVDHNEFSQSVRNIDKAQILEVIDHHRINDFATTQPVSFRNEIIGSTATIISTMFRENQIPMPKDLAGLLLGAILSDTLNFQSPTTTEKDKAAANILAALADLDIDRFAYEMFSASAAGDDQTMYEKIVQDIKHFDISGVDVMVSQVLAASAEQVRRDEKEIRRSMDQLVAKKDIDLLVVCFTSIPDDGTIFFSAGEKADVLQQAFPDEAGKLSVHKGIFSRKKQILPRLTEVLESM